MLIRPVFTGSSHGNTKAEHRQRSAIPSSENLHTYVSPDSQKARHLFAGKAVSVVVESLRNACGCPTVGMARPRSHAASWDNVYEAEQVRIISQWSYEGKSV